MSDERNGRCVTLLTLSDDLLVLIARQIYNMLCLCRFFQICTRTLSTSESIEILTITANCCSMLMPPPWSARFVRLKSFNAVDSLSMSGAARLIVHLRLWPQLEDLSVSVADDDSEFVGDLADALRSGFVRLPELKRLIVTDPNHYAYVGPDANLLAALPPTAQLWWMAERPQHVRCRKISQWRQLAEQADLQWTDSDVNGYTLLSWLSSQLPFWHHSKHGYTRVYGLLRELGASDMVTKTHYYKEELSPNAIYKRMVSENAEQFDASWGVVDGLDVADDADNEFTAEEESEDES